MDNLNQIAWLRVLIDVLTDMEPDGQWQQHPLLQQWQANHYSLTRRQMTELCRYLNHQRELASRIYFLRKYKQIGLWDEVNQ